MNQAAANRFPFSRRGFLVGSAACVAAGGIVAQEPSRPSPKDCPRCGGVGRLPLNDAKPFVWLEGTPRPRPESFVDEQYCPRCQPGKDAASLVAEAREQIDAAMEKHRQWEDRTGWNLLLAITRHEALHTQLSAAQTRAVAMAIESLTHRLKQTTSSVALTPTRPSTYELVILWERPSWDHFRDVMEGLYTREQLGEAWVSVREYNSYDHFVTPHLYETPTSVRTRPPTCGPVFLAARRQISIATDRRTPLWLTEGFAAYGDYLVHKTNRWFTVYQAEQALPIGDWMQEARRMAGDARFRPWDKLLKRELRDWQPVDYVQTMAFVAFLLETEPEKFLALLRNLAAGEADVTALQSAYKSSLEELGQRCERWLLARR
jgi:hypothetical protein